VSWIDTNGDFLMLESEASSAAWTPRFLKMVILIQIAPRQEVIGIPWNQGVDDQKDVTEAGWTKERTPGRVGSG